MDFGKAFSYQFEDQEWLKKIGIAGLIQLIPFVGQFFVSGWSVETTRRVIQRNPEPLADWSDFGGYLVKGLLVLVIGFVYVLPILVVELIGIVPSIFLGDSSSDIAGFILGGVWLCVMCLVILYAILLAFVLPAAIGNFAASGELGAAFRFSEVIALVRAAPVAYLLVLLGSLIAGFIAMLGLVACIIGVLVTVPYANSIIAHLQGQAYIEATAKLSTQTVQEY